jgi:uncharacterized protein DUF6882
MSDTNNNIQNKQIKQQGLPTISIIPDALKYYDENAERYTKIRRKIKYFKRVRSMTESEDQADNISSNDTDQIDTDHVIYSFYDKDKKLLFTSRIEFIGKYYADQHIWIWAWALPNINKSHSTTIRNVFLYGTDINVINFGETNFENFLLKNELITSRSIITDIIQVDIHCALASYLAKKPFILPFADTEVDEETSRYYPFSDYRPDETSSDINTDDSNHVTAPKMRGQVVYYLYILDPPGA